MSSKTKKTKDKSKKKSSKPVKIDKERATVGDRVKLLGSGATGTIRFIGEIKKCKEIEKGIYCGIELDKPGKFNCNDGKVGGVQYFKCGPKKGTFLPKDALSKIINDGDNKDRLDITYNDRVYVTRKECHGTVRFIGVPSFNKKDTVYCGIELDEPKGKTNGTATANDEISGKARWYFDAKEKHAAFTPFKKERVKKEVKNKQKAENKDDEKAEILPEKETPKEPKKEEETIKNGVEDKSKNKEEIKEEEKKQNDDDKADDDDKEATPEVILTDFVTKDGAIIDQNKEETKEQNVDINDDESVLVHRPESPKSGDEKRRKEYGKYKLQQAEKNGTSSTATKATTNEQPSIPTISPQPKSEHTSIKMLLHNNYRKRAMAAANNANATPPILRNYGNGQSQDRRQRPQQQYPPVSNFRQPNNLRNMQQNYNRQNMQQQWQPLNAPKPSYTPFRSVSQSTGNWAKSQKIRRPRIQAGPTFDEDVICWAFNSQSGCTNGANCQWVHECYDTSKESGYDVCWTYNTEAGCKYGNRCEWRHCRMPDKIRTIRKSR